MSRSRNRRAALALLVTAAALRVGAAFQAEALWRDEANDVFLSRNSASVSALLSNIRQEGTPPLRFLVEYPVHRFFPDTVWPARALVIVFGVAAAGVTGLVAGRAFGASAGVVTMALVALSPFFIRYSVELRGYGLLQLVAAAFCLAMLRLWRRPSLGSALVSGTVGGALILVHYYGLFLVASAAIAGAVLDRRREARLAFGLAALVACGALAAVAPIFIEQATADLRAWALPNRRLIDAVAVFFLPFGPPGAVLLAAAAAVFWLQKAPSTGGMPAPDEARRIWLFLLAAAVGANASGWLIQLSGVARARQEPQYLLPASLWLMPVAGAGLAAILRGVAQRPLQARRLAIAAGVILLALAGWRASAADWLRPRGPGAALASVLRERGRPTDLLVVVPVPLASTVSYHYDGPIEQWAPPFRHRITNVPWRGLAGRLENEAERDAVCRALEAALREGRRVWLVAGPQRLDRGFAFDEPVPPTRTAYERAILTTLQSMLRVLYRGGRAEVQELGPERPYWEPLQVVLFDPKAGGGR